MNKKILEPESSRSLPPQRPAVCVSEPANNSKHTPTDSFNKARARNPGRKSLSSTQILNTTEICSRFEQLSGRGGSDTLEGEGINKRKPTGTESPATI